MIYEIDIMKKGGDLPLLKLNCLEIYNELMPATKPSSLTKYSTDNNKKTTGEKSLRLSRQINSFCV